MLYKFEYTVLLEYRSCKICDAKLFDTIYKMKFKIDNKIMYKI
jgi:hypothetical protein